MSETAAARSYTGQEIEEMDTQELLRLYKETGDETLKWPLVLRYEGLIKSAAMQIRGVYSSFAQIRGMVIDLARKQDWIPRNVRKRAKEIDAAVAELSASLGRMPSDGEIASHLGVSQERYQKDAANVALSNVLSLDALMDTRETAGYQLEVPSNDTQSQPEAMLQKRELQRALAKGISQLRENEQIVLSLYYEKNLHLKEIAQVMELSEPRISQIHTRAIQKLRSYMEAYLNGTEETKNRRKKG